MGRRSRVVGQRLDLVYGYGGYAKCYPVSNPLCMLAVCAMTVGGNATCTCTYVPIISMTNSVCGGVWTGPVLSISGRNNRTLTISRNQDHATHRPTTTKQTHDDAQTNKIIRSQDRFLYLNQRE